MFIHSHGTHVWYISLPLGDFMVDGGENEMAWMDPTGYIQLLALYFIVRVHSNISNILPN